YPIQPKLNVSLLFLADSSALHVFPVAVFGPADLKVLGPDTGEDFRVNPELFRNENKRIQVFGETVPSETAHVSPIVRGHGPWYCPMAVAQPLVELGVLNHFVIVDVKTVSVQRFSDLRDLVGE